MNIAGRKIGSENPPFIIGEMSGNHNQSLDRAIEIVEAAAKAGVDAIKLQTYTADTMTLDLSEGEFFISDPENLWEGTSLYKLYEQAYTPWEWHDPIFKRIRELGMVAFSSPFDESAVDFLESLDTPCYKIASFENIHIPLIRKVAATGKPVIISTGMATLEELQEAVDVARQAGCNDIILLKCTSTYPAKLENSNLLTIPHMRDHFKCEVGLSDHTMGVTAALGSIAYGASVIEKHITLRRSDGGVDSAFSMEPEEMALLVREAKQIKRAMGEIHYGPTEAESESVMYRRSLYICNDLNAGDEITSENVRAIRPGRGLPPKFMDKVLGMKVKIDVKCGTPLSWDIIE